MLKVLPLIIFSVGIMYWSMLLLTYISYPRDVSSFCKRYIPSHASLHLIFNQLMANFDWKQINKSAAKINPTVKQNIIVLHQSNGCWIKILLYESSPIPDVGMNRPMDEWIKCYEIISIISNVSLHINRSIQCLDVYFTCVNSLLQTNS